MSTILVVRAVNALRQSHNGFQYPEQGPVEAPDWDGKPECGGGLHGLEWGLGDWSLLPVVPGTLYQVIAVEDTPENLVRFRDQSKVKFAGGEVVYSGSLAGAFDVLRQAKCPWMQHTAGDGAPAATAGDEAPAATAGNRAPAATAGNWAPAATAGNWAVAACLGPHGKASCGKDGAIILVWYDEQGRPWPKVKTDAVPGIWYVLNALGEIVEEAP